MIPSLVYCMGTQGTQHKPQKVATEASDYTTPMHLLLEGPHCGWHFIFNMDQMLVYFSMTLKKLLDVIGIKTIHVCMSMNDTKHAMVAVTIAADSTVFPLTIMFKGKPGGHTEQKEFIMYPVTPHHYKC